MLTFSRKGKVSGTIAAAAAAAMMYTATPAKAGSIVLQGIVALACTISAADAGAGTLDLSASQTNLTIANVTEDCNDSNGYTITIATANGTTSGVMVSQDVNGANATDLNYSIAYDGGAVSLSGGSGTAASRTSFTLPLSAPLAISYTIPAGGLPADTYADTLTLTITAG